MAELTLGVLGRSGKENERRLPIHPLHFDRVDDDLRSRIFVEHGYGEGFGIGDEQISPEVGGLRSREKLVAECDVILLPKPLPEDLAELRPRQVLWGWPHCVQDEQIAQLGIDRRLTLLAWEAMNHWNSDGSFGIHVFHLNNELAGYCSVLHAMQLVGTTAAYGPRPRAAVISFGATARGAVTALNALGVHDITVLTHRDTASVGSPIPSVVLVRQQRREDDPSRTYVTTAEGAKVPVAEVLAQHDIVVNCVLQDTEAPLMFVTDAELALFPPRSLFVDVSCDEGMGFEWARPTSFEEPMFRVGNGARYYAVDHSPSYLWNSATWTISEALIPFLRTVLGGPDAWAEDPTIHRAVEIRDGVVQNPRILSFQHRSPDYPHAKL
jgi:alanine dehydrogenase